MRALRWGAAGVAGAAGVVVAFAALIGIEVQLARGGAQAPSGPERPHGDPAGPAGTPVDSVVWLGDSTAAGIGAANLGETLAEQTAALVGRPVTLTVLAVSGETVSQVLHNQVPAAAVIRPTVVYISVGANDATHLTSRASFRREYAAVLAGLPSSVRTIVVLGVPDMGSPPRLAQPLRAVAGWRGRLLDDDVRHLAARTPKAAYVDIAGRTGPTFRAHPDRYFATDHYHPNGAGYALWAKAAAGD